MDKQAYYEYDPGHGYSWWRKEVPTAEPFFQKELNELAGLSDHGQPKLRLAWAGTLLHDITEKPQLKYKAVREIITGYYYLATDDTIGMTSSMNMATDAKVPWEFQPKTERIELGRLRWCIEVHVPADELKRLGRFTYLHAANGEKVLRSLPPEGVYDHFFWIQTADRKYRDPDRQVLEAIKAMWQYDIGTSAAQRTLDDIEREQTQTLVGAAESRAIFSNL